MNHKGPKYPFANNDSSSDDSLIVYYRSASSQSAIDQMKTSPGRTIHSTQQALDINFISSHFTNLEDRTGSTSHTTTTTTTTNNNNNNNNDNTLTPINTTAISHGTTNNSSSNEPSSNNVVQNNETAERIRARRAARRNHRVMNATKNSLLERSLENTNSTRIMNGGIKSNPEIDLQNNEPSKKRNEGNHETNNNSSLKPKPNNYEIDAKTFEDNNNNDESLDTFPSTNTQLSEIQKKKTTIGSPITPTMEKKAIAQNFAMEHKIFLRAILQLLYEREQYAIEEANVNDPSSTLKTGPLKKATIGGVFWKVKYVEIRRGVFSYYEDDISEGGELQCKSLPLRADQCHCRAVKVKKRSSKSSQSTSITSSDRNKNVYINRKGSDDESNPLTTGAIFELTIGGGSRRLWMANSREDRQAWIRAIYGAMIGGPVIRGDNFFKYQREGKRSSGKKLYKSKIPNRSPYKADLETYLWVQNKLKHASTKNEYMDGLTFVYGKSFYVPVEWIKELMEEIGSPSRSSVKKKKKKKLSSSERLGKSGAISSEVSQLWKDMLRDSLSINGELYEGGSGNGPEKIVGALMHCILNFDRSSPFNDDELIARKNTIKKQYILESQAVVYARDILLACNRTRSGGDSYLCVESLCRNPELVVLCPSSNQAEPLKIIVRHSSVDELQKHPDVIQDPSDISGWVYVRKRSQKFWKQRFCVLSGDTLSFYKKALPRPHIFRWSVHLKMASIKIRNENDSVFHKNDMHSINKILGRTNSTKKNSKSMESKSPSNRPLNPITKYHIVSITPTDDFSQENQLLFVDESNFSLWKQHILSAIDQTNDDDILLPPKANGGLKTPPKSDKNANDTSFLKHDATSPDSGVETNDTNDGNVTTTNHLNGPNSTYRQGDFAPMGGKKGRATVEISIQVSTVYKICTIDPQGDESEDTWT